VLNQEGQMAQQQNGSGGKSVLNQEEQMAQQQNGSGGNIDASATNNANSLILHVATEFVVEGLDDNSPQWLFNSLHPVLALA
jgi:hypothetical protein